MPLTHPSHAPTLLSPSAKTPVNLEAVRLVREEKLRLALPWTTMRELAEFLRTHFGIRKPPDGFDVFDSIRATCGDLVADEYEALNDERAYGSPKKQKRAERRFYDLISQDPLLGMVHSQKWPFIFDAGAYLTELARATRCPGPFLDLGCHAGYHALWLHRALGIPGLGIDRSEEAVRYARAKAQALGVTPAEVSFDARRANDAAPERRYSLIYSVDGPDLLSRATELCDLSDLLADDGLIVVIGGGAAFENDQFRSSIERAGLSLSMTDVVGGWDGQEFAANCVFVMTRGDVGPVIEGTRREAEWIWNNGFSEFCNAAGRTTAEKTLAIYRSHMAYGPMPPGLLDL